MQAGAAAGKALSLLIPGEKMELEAMVSVINEEKCSGCKICVPLCPYKAINFNHDKKVSEIQPALCTGCGTCVGACPSGAITANNFEESQIYAELLEVVK